MKVNQLEGAALDWAVTKAEGFDAEVTGPEWGLWGWATDWGQGGPIIEREWLDITPWPNESNEDLRWHCQQHDTANDCAQYGPTPLIAAMRCYVASRFGDEIEVPAELLQGEEA